MKARRQAARVGRVAPRAPGLARTADGAHGATRPTIHAAANWETSLCELELRLTQLEVENERLRTALRQAEASIEPQAQLEDFVSVGLLTLDTRGMILDINRAGVAILGFSKHRLVNRPFTSLVQPDNISAFMSHLRRARRSQKAVIEVLHLHAIGGRNIVAQVSSLPMVDRRSRVSRILTTLIDITEPHQTGQALRASEQNLRALIDASPYPIQFKDSAGRWVLANPAMLELFGLTGLDYHNKREAELAVMSKHFDGALEAHRRKDIAAMASGKMSRHDEVIQNPDGSVRMVDFIKVPLRDDAGGVKGLVVLGYDITERKQDEQRIKDLNRELQAHAEQLEQRVRERTAELNQANLDLNAEFRAHQQAERALRESEARLQAIMNNSPSMIFLKDIQGRYLHFNQRFATELNLRLEETVGKNDHQLFSPQQAALLRTNELAVIAAGAPIVFDEVVEQVDGPHTSIVTKFPLFDADGKVYAVGGIATDITERKRLEEEILQTSERERRRIAQDLHDGLGQQLTGIWCLAEVMRKNLKAESPPHARAAGRLSRMLKSAVGLTRDLARGLHPVEAEPSGLMSALESLAARVGSVFRVDCVFECNQPVLIEDKNTATQLYRIAQEAATNSIKHGRAKKILIALSAPAELIILSISDNGTGFKKTVNRRTGLGMRIMTHRAGLIGGTLIVQKNVEGGVKVVCALSKTNAITPPPAAHEQKNTQAQTAPAV